MTFPAGSIVKKIDGTPFSNGEMTATVSSEPPPASQPNRVWLVETKTHTDTSELKLVSSPQDKDAGTLSMPSVQMLRAERMKMALEAILDLYEPDHRVYKYAKAGLTGKTAAETDY